MGNTKHRKNHKQKLQARKERIKQDKNKVQKMQKEFIMKLIKKEQEKGMFDNIPTINPIGLEGTVIEGPTI